MPIEKIIVLEDDPVQRKNLESLLRYRRYDVASATTIAQAEEFLAKDNFDLILVDVQLPDGDGTELLKRLQTKPTRPMAIIMTAFASIEAAVDCMSDGAFHYLVKPFSAEQLDVILKKAEEFTQLVRVNRFLSNEELENERYALIGESPAMRKLREMISRVAAADATVLIQGESGTGKELVARAIVAEGPRAGRDFIRVNCAAVPENLIESEFFGHEKGSFTGATGKREGRFELANRGTILLDEVSEVSPQVQAKLLRVLQEQEFERVGGSRTIKVDVRVIATTNRNMAESVALKEFRADLYYRLNVVPIPVPPLRERMEDVPLLANTFRQRFARQHGREVVGISDGAMQILLEHRWPGNVRELQNVIERAVIMCDHAGSLEPIHLGFGRGAEGISALVPSSAGSASSGVASSTVGAGSALGVSLGGGSAAGINAASVPGAAPATGSTNPVFVSNEPALVAGGSVPTLSEIEKRHILATLEFTKGNRTRAAELLQISIRTLRNKLNEYGYKNLSSGTAPAV